MAFGTADQLRFGRRENRRKTAEKALEQNFNPGPLPQGFFRNHIVGKEILTTHQKALLNELSSQDFIRDFYLTGGTALAAFYLNHRYSEDLDFFTQEENIDLLTLTTVLESLKQKLAIQKIDFQKSLNRNLFFVTIEGQTTKIEFTYFPFGSIEKGPTENKLAVDSLLDIAVNKVFTIYQQPRARDFVDLFFIVREKNYTFAELIAKAKIKFDWHIDPLNLGSQMMRMKDLKDYPRMIKKLEEAKLADFFIKEAKKLKSAIVD